MGQVQLPTLPSPASTRLLASHSTSRSYDQSDDVVSGKYDLIGPPRSISNLRPWKFAVPAEETELQRRLRELRQETQNFNQEWWTKHNTESKMVGRSSSKTFCPRSMPLNRTRRRSVRTRCPYFIEIS